MRQGRVESYANEADTHLLIQLARPRTVDQGDLAANEHAGPIGPTASCNLRVVAHRGCMRMQRATGNGLAADGPSGTAHV